MKRLSQSGSSNFCPELRKNALLISQSHFSNFALHVIRKLITTKKNSFPFHYLFADSKAYFFKSDTKHSIKNTKNSMLGCKILYYHLYYNLAVLYMYIRA